MNFLDEFIGNQYQKETNLSRQLILFSLLSILIALIGVFGLVLFETQYRRREIAVRKVFGATIPEVPGHVQQKHDPHRLVCFLIAAPTAWYIVHRWLEGFAYKFRMGF
ncbi:MAG: FtsX-like permease family protein [Alistipes indistinctus]